MKIEVTPYHYATEIKDGWGLVMRDAGWYKDESLIFECPEEEIDDKFPHHVCGVLQNRGNYRVDRMVIKCTNADAAGTYTWDTAACIWVKSEKEGTNV